MNARILGIAGRQVRAAVWLGGATAAGLLLGACINIQVDPHVAAPAARTSPDDPNMEYAPYAYELRRVLDQQATIESELSKRDWEELREELSDWQKYIRRLRGVANTSDAPDLMRRLCDELAEHLSVMKRGQRARDAATVTDALDGAARPLDRLSAEFPLMRRKTPTAAE